MQNDIEKILELVGGKENIISLSHCITRLRFVLKDEELAKANTKEIDKLENVKGSFAQGGQFQVIIGNEVKTAYKMLCETAGIEGASKEEVKAAIKSNQNRMQRIVGFLAEIFIPIVPVLVAGGLILGIRNLLNLPLPELLAGQSITQVSTFWNGVYQMLGLISDAVFTFLPVYVVASIFKKMTGDYMIGVCLGIMLVSPQLVGYNVVVKDPTALTYWDFGAFQIPMISYPGQVIPAMMVGIFGGWVHNLVEKYAHPYIRLIAVPLVTLIVTMVVSWTVIAPIGLIIGFAIGQIVIWLFATLGVIGGFIFGFTWPLVVLSGLHQIKLPIEAQLIAQTGTDFIFPICSAFNVAVGASVLGTLMVKKSAKHKEVAYPTFISAWLGVTEPAMYGVSLKLMSPFVATMIGSGCAGAWMVAMEVTSTSIGMAGIFGILSMSEGDWLNYFIGMCIAGGVTYVCTVIFMKKRIMTNDEEI